MSKLKKKLSEKSSRGKIWDFKQDAKDCIWSRFYKFCKQVGQKYLRAIVLLILMEESRKITNDIVNKLAAAKHIEDRLEENRRILKPLAVQAAKLFL